MARQEPAWWAECRRLRETGEGWTHEALAARFDVSTETIRLVLNPEARAKKRATETARYRSDPELRAWRSKASAEWHKRNRAYRREYERRYRAARRAAQMAAE